MYATGGSSSASHGGQVLVTGGAVTGTFLETTTAAAGEAVIGREIQVASGRFVNLSITGQDAFVDPNTNEDAFAILRDAVALLRNPAYPNGQEGATPQDTYLRAFNDKGAQLDEIFDQVQISRTKVGSTLNYEVRLTRFRHGRSSSILLRNTCRIDPLPPTTPPGPLGSSGVHPGGPQGPWGSI